MLVLANPPRANSKEKHPKNLLLIPSAIVVGTITFDCCKEDDSDLPLSMWIQWLAVMEKHGKPNNVLHAPPELYDGWRKVGLGKLMIILALKYTILSNSGNVVLLGNKDFILNHPVDVYLQVSNEEAAATSFYSSIGFLPTNPTSGKSAQLLLPARLRTKVCEVKHGWIDDTVCSLWLLRSGRMICKPYRSCITPTANSDLEGAGVTSDLFMYSFFPEKPDIHGHVFTHSRIQKFIHRLPILDSLLPPLVGLSLAPPGSNGLKGSMYAVRQKKHTPTTWLNEDEIELLLAFLMRDGRYQSVVTVFPPRHTLMFCCAYSCSKIQEQEWLLKLQKVVNGNLDMFSKRLLVFIHNKNNCHWTATFVFNPDCIVWKDKLKWRSERCAGYLFYDPMACNQTSAPTFEHGTFYFLNYASSYIQWKQNGDQAAPLDFIHPFGRSRHVYVQTDDGSDVEEEDKEWEPTEAFPVFEMDADDALPKQDDKHSCGLAVVVGCSNMMRAIYDASFSSLPLYEVFLTKNMKLFGNKPPAPRKWERPRQTTWTLWPHCFCPILYSRRQGTKIFHFQNCVKKCWC